MARTPVIAGNWKMFKTREEARQTARDLLARVGNPGRTEVLICPPFTALGAVQEVLEGSAIGWGAQNVHWEEEGAFTGEISVGMLLECGCRYVILGHSERRQYFHEEDEMIHRKLEKVLQSPLIPILCVGESLSEREAGRVREVVLGQLSAALATLTLPAPSRIMIAYEPVWAIGTGRTATPETAQEVHRMIRRFLEETFSTRTAEEVRILYGGSVKPENISHLMAKEDIDGALVGGASLDAATFAKIVALGRGE